MTINDLQEALIREIEKITKEINLVNCRGENVYLKGYQQAIPLMSVRASDGLLDEDASPDEAELFPYFITRVAVSYTHLDVYKRQLLQTIPNRPFTNI